VIDERQPGLAAAADRVAESGLDDRLDLGGPRPRLGLGLGVNHGATARLEIAHLDEQEVVLPERVRQLCTRHPDQWQELLAGQEVPVASEHRDIRPAGQAWGNVSCRWEAQRRGQLRELIFVRPEHPCQDRRPHELPVAPDDGVQPAGKVLESDRPRGGPHR